MIRGESEKLTKKELNRLRKNDPLALREHPNTGLHVVFDDAPVGVVRYVTEQINRVLKDYGIKNNLGKKYSEIIVEPWDYEENIPLMKVYKNKDGELLKTTYSIKELHEDYMLVRYRIRIKDVN
jgi:hypothetical protein